MALVGAGARGYFGSEGGSRPLQTKEKIKTMFYAFILSNLQKLARRVADAWEAGPAPCWTDYLHDTRD